MGLRIERKVVIESANDTLTIEPSGDEYVTLTIQGPHESGGMRLRKADITVSKADLRTALAEFSGRPQQGNENQAIYAGITQREAYQRCDCGSKAMLAVDHDFGCFFRRWAEQRLVPGDLA